MIILSVDRQAELFLLSLFYGICASFLYDFIKIFRLIIHHKKIAEYAEDILYWIFCGFALFAVMLKNNSGEIRIFSITAFFTAMIIYNATIGKKFYLLSQKLILMLKKQLKPLITIVCMPFKFFCGIFKNTVFYFVKPAEKKLYTVLILIQKCAKIKPYDLKLNCNKAYKKRGLKNGKKIKQKK